MLKNIGQAIASAAAMPAHRAALLATPGLKDMLSWLVEHGGEPIGKRAQVRHRCYFDVHVLIDDSRVGDRRT